MISSEALKSMLFKLVRLAIKKLQLCCQKARVDAGDLVRLNDNRVKLIIYQTHGREVKIKLLEFYSEQQVNTNTLKQAVMAVNVYIANM